VCNYRYAEFSACHDFFSLFVCHSSSQSQTSSILLVSLESRSWSWTSKSWSWTSESWSWNLRVLFLVLDKQVLNPSLCTIRKHFWYWLGYFVDKCRFYILIIIQFIMSGNLWKYQGKLDALETNSSVRPKGCRWKENNCHDYYTLLLNLLHLVDELYLECKCRCSRCASAFISRNFQPVKLV